MSKFVHMELSTSDPEAAQRFYKAIFGWKYQKMPMPDGSVYVGFTADGEGIGGGIQKSQSPGEPPQWLGYIGVESVKKTLAKIEKNGGKILTPQIDLPNLGSMAIFEDPQGARFALWQPAVRPGGSADAGGEGQHEDDEASAEDDDADQAPARGSKKAGGTKKKAGKKTGRQDASAEQAEPARGGGRKTGKKAGKQSAQAEQAAPARGGGRKAGKKAGNKQEPTAGQTGPARGGKKATKKKPGRRG